MMSVKVEKEEIELDQMCRACLGNENELVDLFWKMDSADRDLTLADIFMMCTPVEVFKEDGMPQKLCELCINSLTSAYEFRARCQQNDLILKSMLGNIENVTTVTFNKEQPQIKESPPLVVNEDDEVAIKVEADDGYDEDAEAAANLNRLMGGELESYFSTFNPIEKKSSRKKKESSTELYLVSKKICTYKCAECTKEFSNYRSFHRHMQNHERQLEKLEIDQTAESNETNAMDLDQISMLEKERKKSDYQCGECGLCFDKRVRLNEHTITHSKRKVLSRNIDSNVIKKKRKTKLKYTRKKMKKVTKKRTVSLLKKELPFVTKKLIEENTSQENFTLEVIQSEYHRLRNIKGKSMQKNKTCSLCSKSTERIQSLKNHVVEHILKFVRTSHPAYGSIGSDNLNWSVKNHPFRCNYCCNGKEFFSMLHLKTHLWESLNITTYKCKLCNKTFGNSSNFSKHKKVHGMHFYSCKLCRRKFTTVEMLIKHKEYHLENEPIECCGKMFHFPSMWKKHYTSSHGAPKKVYSKKTLSLHQCKECKINFPSLQDNWQHSWSVHGLRHYEADCSFCDKKFRNLSHLKVHLDKDHQFS